MNYKEKLMELSDVIEKDFVSGGDKPATRQEIYMLVWASIGQFSIRMKEEISNQIKKDLTNGIKN